MMRTIQPNTYKGNQQLMFCLQSFAVLELIQNSPALYIHVPLLQDTTIILNKAGEFSSVLPDIARQQLRLTELLMLLAERGSEIHISYRDEVSPLILENLQHSGIQIRQYASIYPPGWITKKYALSGLIYFRSDRLDFFEDEIKIFTEPDEVDKLLLNAQSAW